MEKIKISNPIKIYAIENEDGAVIAEVKINTHDDNFISKFADLYEWADKADVRIKERIDKLGLSEKEQITVTDCKEYLEISNDVSREIIEKTEDLFGKGLIKKIYADAYEINPDFVPSMQLLLELYAQLSPLVQDVFKGRTAKYSVSRKR